MCSPPAVDALREQLASFVRAEIVSPEITFTYTTPLRKIGIDSYSIVELVLFIERRFKVTMPESELTPGNLESIDSLAQCVHRIASGEQSSHATSRDDVSE